MLTVHHARWSDEGLLSEQNVEDGVVPMTSNLPLVICWMIQAEDLLLNMGLHFLELTIASCIDIIALEHLLALKLRPLLLKFNLLF